jgi:hypothetical protein
LLIREPNLRGSDLVSGFAFLVEAAAPEGEIRSTKYQIPDNMKSPKSQQTISKIKYKKAK